MTAWRRVLTAALLASVIAYPAPPAAAGVIEANLEVVGRSDLESLGLYGDVTVVGTTAIVATEAPVVPGSPCPTATAKVVDLKNPGKPRVVASIPFPPGMVAADVDSATVLTPAFTGDLVALALSPLPGSCPAAPGPVVAYHDVTDAQSPRFLAQTPTCPQCGAGPYSVSLAQRADGKVLAARADGTGTGVAIDDVTDPAHPVPVGRWPDPVPAGAPCPGAATGGATVGAVLHGEGEGALAMFTDRRIYDLALSDPAQPSATGEPQAGAGGRVSAHAAVLPLGNRTIAIVAEDHLDDGCAGTPPEPGLRVLALDRETPPREMDPVRFPGAAGPGRLVASGELAYVAWHGAGLRVIDFSQVRARTVAQFAPAQPDVVGVALLPQHIVVTDLTSGLYVLDRPEEAGGRATFWSQFLGLLPYLGFAGVAAAMLLVPRLVRARATSGSTVPTPSPSPVPRRPA
ncbi:MAG: LVIVD repeat-containing protein [Acidimicrobiales bacterium]